MPMHAQYPGELAQAIEAFERRLQVRVVFHDYFGLLRQRLHPDRLRHSAPACRGPLATAPRACAHCDITGLHRPTMHRPRGFWKRCHAGILEVVVPLWASSERVGTMFVGSFTWTGEGVPADLVDLSDSADSAAADAAELSPLTDGETMKELLICSRVLAGYIGWSLASPVSFGLPLSRKQEITRYLERSFMQPITLDDCAAALNLSPGATSKLIQELFACSFRELLNRFRIEQARRLLAYTEDTVQSIAEHCGYSDAAYFNRVFKPAVGCTSTEYRDKGWQDSGEFV